MKKYLLAFVITTALLALSNYSYADKAIYGYKDHSGQLFLTNIKQNTSGAGKFTEIGVTYYPDTKLHSSNSIPATYDPNTASTPSRSANKNTYDHLIRAAATRHGVDPALIKAIIHTESAFNSSARSPVGAMGLMQLMPATAREMGVGNAYDPAQNIEGGVKYLAWLKRQFSNLDHVIAAYNAGHGNVKKYGGIPPFRETQNYVRSVNGRYHTLYKNDPSLLSGYIAQTTQTQTSIQPITTNSARPTIQTNLIPSPQSPNIVGNSGRIYISNGGN